MGSFNVIVLTTSYPIAEASVSGVFVARLLESMPQTIQFTVLTPAAPTFEPTSTLPNIQIRTFRYAPRRWQVLAHQPGGIPVALERNPLLYLLVPFFLLSMFIALLGASKDAQLIHANWSICGYVAGLVRRLRRIPVVTTIRGEDLNRAATSRLSAFIVRSALRSNDRIVTVSDAFKNKIDEEYPAAGEKSQTISNGVGDEFIRIGNERCAPTNDSGRRFHLPLRLISVGSLIPRKGMDVILRAISRLPEPRAIQLSIAGGGAKLGELRTLADDLGLGEQVSFIGEKAPTEIAALLQSHHVFILASHSEGRPNVVLEAKAAGLAVIASNIDGVREIIEHERDGLLFDDDSDEQLATQIERLLRCPDEIHRYGTRAHRSIIDKQLTWHGAADQYHAVYHAIISAQRD